MLVDDNADVIAGFYGPCPDHYPTAFRAELRAVLELLVMAVSPINIFVDNQEVVDGWTKGQTWCCSVGRSAADLWRIFWRRINDIGDDGISIIKCKGHATAADVLAGRSTPFTRKGNDHADHFAGQGADLAEEFSPSTRWRLQYSQASQWYSWLSTLCSQWPKDVDPKPKARPRRAAPTPSTVHTPKPASARSAVSLAVDERVTKLHPSHRLRCVGDMLWCDCCGAYGQLRFKDLKEPCRGKDGAANRQGQLTALRNGRHPSSGAELGAARGVQQCVKAALRSRPSSRPCPAIDKDVLCKAALKLQGLVERRTACALGILLTQ